MGEIFGALYGTKQMIMVYKNYLRVVSGFLVPQLIFLLSNTIIQN